MRADRPPRSTRRRILPLGLVAVALAGCASTTQSAASAGTASMLVNATTGAVAAATDAVESAVGIDTRTGPALQREQMQQQAGTAHFANSQLVSGRTSLQKTRIEFGVRRDKFVSSPFVAARNQFRGEQSTPSSGPVLGPAVGDSAAALALLAAAGGGVPLPVAQPVLAQLLPGFGY